jgi:hypothetical protein
MDIVYLPTYDYVDLEVFIGPRTPSSNSFVSDEQPVFVDYARVGALEIGWPEEAEEFRNDMQRIRTKESPEGGEEPALSKEFFQKFGTKLFHILFNPKLEAVYRDRLSLARHRTDGALRLNLCFDPLDLPPDLALAPWEYVFDPEEELFLASSEGIAFSRSVPTTQYVEPLTVTKPLRILVAISNPIDLQCIHPKLTPLDVVKERETIETALKDCKHVELGFVPDPTSSANLWKSLREFKPNIFHFIGHGVWRDSRPHLVVATDENKVRHMDEDMFRDLLRGQDDLRVVFLSACQSGEVQIQPGEPTENCPWDETGMSKSLVGIAPELLKIGIPAVLAMQHSVRMDTARRFASRFYQALAREDPIDTAVNLAREDLRFEAENRRDFGTPVLYTLIPRLFKLELSDLMDAIDLDEVPMLS